MKAEDFLRFYPLIEGARRYRLSAEDVPDSAAVRILSGVSGDSGKGWKARLVERIGSTDRVMQLRIGGSGIVEGDRTILKGPLEAGTAWTDGPDDFRIDSISESVTVPAGTFSACLKVVYFSEDIGGGALWLAEGTGLVKMEQWGERGAFLYELET